MRIGLSILFTMFIAPGIASGNSISLMADVSSVAPESSGSCGFLCFVAQGGTPGSDYAIVTSRAFTDQLSQVIHISGFAESSGGAYFAGSAHYGGEIVGTPSAPCSPGETVYRCWVVKVQFSLSGTFTGSGGGSFYGDAAYSASNPRSFSAPPGSPSEYTINGGAYLLHRFDAGPVSVFSEYSFVTNSLSLFGFLDANVTNGSADFLGSASVDVILPPGASIELSGATISGPATVPDSGGTLTLVIVAAAAFGAFSIRRHTTAN
jgi:hypothetical protein